MFDSVVPVTDEEFSHLRLNDSLDVVGSTFKFMGHPIKIVDDTDDAGPLDSIGTRVAKRVARMEVEEMRCAQRS